MIKRIVPRLLSLLFAKDWLTTNVMTKYDNDAPKKKSNAVFAVKKAIVMLLVVVIRMDRLI